MIAMHYRFVLPADYDMSIIRRRVKEKGHFLDHHQPLLFKAYLCAFRDDPVTRGQENLYAPFYLWQDTQGMSDFIRGAGFRGVVNAFGWPTVRTWPAVLAGVQSSLVAEANHATQEMVTIPPFYPLATIQQEEREWAEAMVLGQGATLALSAFEPTTWSLARFCLWSALPAIAAGAVQAFHLLHLSLPAGRVADFPEMRRRGHCHRSPS